MSIKWPDVLTDMSMLHKKWLLNNELSDVHPKILGFETALKGLRANCNENVLSYGRIGLPFTVEPNFLQHNIGWRDNSSRVLYVDLRALVDDYGDQNESTDFDLV